MSACADGLSSQPYWFAQAMQRETGPPPNGLENDLQTDVCIVGGGYTGLWTAIFLKRQQPNLGVVVIDKGLCGSGASGRNGGCLLTWSTKYSSLKKLYGEPEAIRLVKASEQAVYEIARFCKEHNIDAQLRMNGTLYTATNSAQKGLMNSVLAQLDQDQISSWQQWQQTRVQQESGSALHQEGFYSPVAASVQPAMLARGLKQVAEKMGVKVYENTPMQTFNAKTPMSITTPKATISAKKVVLALNAWMLEKFPQFKRSVVLVSSDMAITKPIPEKLAAMGLKDGKNVVDLRTFVHYYRTTPDGRLMLGKGGNYFPFANKISKVFDQPSRYTQILRGSFNRLFPSLLDEPFVTTWTGASDRSTTGLPFFGKLNGQDDVVYGLGYSGNGVAQTWIGGQILASITLNQENQWSQCGLVSGPQGQFPPEPVRWFGAMLIRNAIRRKERAEDSGRKPFWLDKQLAKLANAVAKTDQQD
ncbi:MAG: FAD-dependent oxidoreductase [Planctomycetota bacterium]|nr:FAD-dependent oxidoreductase [Planctomycetota bacterium]